MLCKVVKIRDVTTPSRAHMTDAVIDFYLPNDSEQIILNPGDSNCIPSGIKIEVPYGYMGLFLNKSGIAAKKSVIIGAQVIDCGYEGEVHIDLHNVGKERIIFRAGDKLAQLVFVPVLCCGVTEIDEDCLYDAMKETSLRGEGGFGSTDKK